MKLNIGSGPHPADGWVNIDMYTHADVVGSIYRLPFRDGVFAQVYMGHVLEHLDLETVPRAIAEVRRVCAEGAAVAIVGPCMNRAVRTRQPEWLLEQIREGGRKGQPGEDHKWTPTETLTLACAISGGLIEPRAVSITEIKKPEWPNANTDPWQCAILATA